ncbi:MAG TPA: S16 family serine protease [Nitrospirales bacterium]|nr:S16 family serine protease [Nitrospirales bacterium]
MLRPVFILVLMLATVQWCDPVAAGADNRHAVSVPAVSVSTISGKQTGRVHYILVQVDQDPGGQELKIQFNEVSLGGGSLVGTEWKEGVRLAVDAARRALDDDGHTWIVTIKNRSYNSMTEGRSASAAVAVAIMSARRGETLRGDTLITGAVSSDGAIGPVGNLPAKLEGAAQARMHMLLVPEGQAQTDDWDLYQQGRLMNVKVIEVRTLAEAYEWMTKGKEGR